MTASAEKGRVKRTPAARKKLVKILAPRESAKRTSSGKRRCAGRRKQEEKRYMGLTPRWKKVSVGCRTG